MRMNLICSSCVCERQSAQRIKNIKRYCTVDNFGVKLLVDKLDYHTSNQHIELRVISKSIHNLRGIRESLVTTV